MFTEADPRVLELERALLAVDRVATQRIFSRPEVSTDPVQRIEGLIVPVLDRIGMGWNEGRVSLSQVYMAGRLCEAMVEAVLPATDPARHSQPPIATAVLEDYHLLGLRIVRSALRSEGFHVHDFGRVELSDLLERVRSEHIAVLLLSELMLPAALRVKDLVRRLRDEGLATRVIVGGAPFRFDRSLAQEVGADAMGTSATEAVHLVRRLLGETP